MCHVDNGRTRHCVAAEVAEMPGGSLACRKTASQSQRVTLTLGKARSQWDRTTGEQKPVCLSSETEAGAGQRREAARGGSGLPGGMREGWRILGRSCRTHPSLHSGRGQGGQDDLGGFLHPGSRELGKGGEEEPVGSGGQGGPGTCCVSTAGASMEVWEVRERDRCRLLSCRLGGGISWAARPISPGKARMLRPEDPTVPRMEWRHLGDQPGSWSRSSHVLCDGTARCPSLGLTGGLVQQMGKGGTARGPLVEPVFTRSLPLAPVESGDHSILWLSRDCPLGLEPSRMWPLGLLGASWALAASQKIAFVFLLPKSSFSRHQVPELWRERAQAQGCPGRLAEKAWFWCSCVLGQARGSLQTAGGTRPGVQARARQSTFLSSSCFVKKNSYKLLALHAAHEGLISGPGPRGLGGALVLGLVGGASPQATPSTECPGRGTWRRS